MPAKKQEEDKDLITLERALLRAEHRGYDIPLLEYMMFVQDRPPSLNSSLKIWARGLIFTHEFASAFFGTHRLDNNGWSLNSINMWAKQVFVKHAGELHAVPDDGRRYMYMLNIPETEYEHIKDNEIKEPAGLVNAQRVEYELKKLAASIPFETHKVMELEAEATVPAYIWHLQQMAVCSNPFEYLQQHMDYSVNEHGSKEIKKAQKRKRKPKVS